MLRETDISGLECDVGNRSDPLRHGTRGERRDQERSAPFEKAPASPRRSQSGGDLELFLARGWKLFADAARRSLVLPRQDPLSGVDRTFGLPPTVAEHDLNVQGLVAQKGQQSTVLQPGPHSGDLKKGGSV